MPSWARKQPARADNGPPSTSSAAVNGRRRGTTISSTTAGGRPIASRVDSWNKRPGSGSSSSRVAAPGTAPGSAGGTAGAAGVAKGPGIKKTEYMGPDGDLVANLERDVLDRSPGIR